MDMIPVFSKPPPNVEGEAPIVTETIVEKFSTEKVGENMAECAVIPASFPIATNHGHDHGGFKPSDAALVHVTETASSARSNLIETSAGAKDNLVQSLETKFQIERSVKESHLATEQSSRRIEVQLAALQASMDAKFAAMENASLKSKIDESNQSVLLAAIKALKP